MQPLISAKQSTELTLVPNQQRRDGLIADALLRRSENQSALSAGQGSVIVAPPIAVFSQWVEALVVKMAMLDGATAPVSPDTLEVDQLWQLSLEQEMEFLAEGERRLAARQARAADRLLNQWWPATEPPRLERAFWAARKHVQAQFADRQWCDAEGWQSALSARLDDPRPLPCALPETIKLQGFHELTRLEQNVLQSLQRRGVTVDTPSGQLLGLSVAARDETYQDQADTSKPTATTTVNSPPELFSYGSLEEELAAAAGWAAEKLADGARRIAVVINQPEALSEQVRGVFEKVLSAEKQLALEEHAECPFYLYHGEPLLNQPIIQDALLLLEISSDGPGRHHEFPVISRWLLSPYWRGADEERSSRAALELRLRDQGAFWCSPDQVLRLARSDKRYDEFEADRDDRLNELIRSMASTTETRPDGSSAARFFTWLGSWGWPGPLATGADVRKSVAAFSKLLEKLDQLQLEDDPDALKTLRNMCAARTISLRGGPLSPIQILGPEDAAGWAFDAAWVANMHDGNWPAQPRVNPFLPAQVNQRVPRGTAEGELAFCQGLTGQLLRIAPRVRFSWSRQSGDVPNAASPLLDALTRHEVPESPAATLRALAAPQSSRLTGYRDHPWLQAEPDVEGVPLRTAVDAKGDSSEADFIPGGAGMINDQSGCPMLAYFRYRLNARFEAAPTPFANPALRGSMMHSAMFYLFEGQVGKPGLPGIDQIGPAVQRALKKHQARQKLPEVSFQAERQRLEKLLAEWLEFEKGRTGFTVHQLEQRFESAFLGHQVSIRVDRIDRLDDGGLVVIDYKSSAGNAAGWSYPRLRQAQLPLYTVLLSNLGAASTGEAHSGGTVTAAALATVRGGECTLQGIAAESSAQFDKIQSFQGRRGGFARKFENWEALYCHWDTCIDQLASEIVKGECANVLYDPNSLTWAGLELLMRRPEGEAWMVAHADQTESVADLVHDADEHPVGDRQ